MSLARHHVLRSAAVLTLTSIALSSCGDDDSLVGPENREPALESVMVATNPHNALSTLVTFTAENVDSARVVAFPTVRKAADGEPAAAREARPATAGATTETPFYPVADGVNRIAVLGLLPQTAYTHVLEAVGDGGTVRDTLQGSSGALPAFLANSVRFAVSGSPSGFTLLNTRERSRPNDWYTLIFDASGRLCWYRHWDVLGGFVSQLHNGNFAVFLGTTTGFHPSFGYYAEVDAGGEIVARYQAPAPFYTDNHELLLTDSPAGPTVHLISYDIRRTDLSAFGGASDAQVAGHQILRLAPDGTLEFMWNAWDHLDFNGWIEGTLPGACQLCDFDHPNSLDIDLEGHYILSNRNYSELLRIDSRTGDILWRLGGAQTTFRFVNDTFGGFSGQHSARVLDNGNILLYDNGRSHTPRESRAVEYQLDPVTNTATQVWEFRHTPPIYTPFLGVVQRLRNGNTVVGFGSVGVVTEVDAAGNVVWEGAFTIDGSPVGIYRFIKIGSLYRYEDL